MANKTINLSQYKAPGVYFLEFDASEYTQINTNTIRLVVGFSKKGVYNRPVLITNKDQAIRVYGDIDTTLESRGSFFHRSLFTCLEAGPVLALALLPVNNGQDLSAPKDEVEYKSFSLDLMEENSKNVKSLYSAFYNKERYWELDSENFDAIIKTNFATKGKLFSVANLGQREVSLIVRKASVQGWKITAQEFYGSTDVPSYLYATDVLEDFFIEVIAFEGVWDDYSKLSTHPIYSKYFDGKGLIKGKIDSFLADETVKNLGSWVGSVIPNLVDGTGKEWSIDTTINSSIATTGIYATLNKEILENYDTKLSTDSSLDLVGHKVAQYFNEDGDSPEFVNMLSYFANFDTYLGYTTSTNSTIFEDGFVDFDGGGDSFITLTSVDKQNTSSGLLNNLIKIQKPDSSDGLVYEEYLTLRDELNVNSALWGTDYSSNVKSFMYFGVSDVYESVEYDNSIRGNRTYLNILVKNPFLKTDIDNAYSFTVQDVENKIVNLTNFPIDNSLLSSNLFIDAYVKPKNPNSTKTPFYVGLNSFYYDEPNVRVVCQWDSLSTEETNRLVAFLEDEDVSQWEMVIPQYIPNYIASGNALPIKYSLNPNYLNWDDNVGYLYAYSGSRLFKDIERGSVYNGLQTYVDGEEDVIRYVKVESLDDFSGIPTKRLSFYTETSLSPNSKTYMLDVDTLFYIVSLVDSKLVEEFNTTDVTNNGKTVTTDDLDVSEFKVGDYIATEKVVDGESVLYLIPITSMINNNNGTFTIKTNDTIYFRNGNGYFILVKNIDRVATNYTITSLKGLKITDYHLPGNFLNRDLQLAKILGVIAPGTNIYKSLTDNENTKFRYIVDTFSGGLSAELFPKNYLSRLARDKQRCLALLNAPSIKEFKESTNPLFKDLPTNEDPAPSLRVDYIRDGGNQTANTSVRFSLPSEENGSKYAGVFISYPLAKSGRNIIPVPPSAGISNRFVSKHTDGSKYNAVAGKYGSFSVTGATGGIEYNFTTEERGYLAEIGLNPIVWRQNSGYTIYDDLMAYQRTLSAFNNLSLRDLLISIEEGIDSILTNYLFDNNTQFLRDEISSKLKTFLSTIQTGGGLVAFRVTMDDTNNTTETITAGFGIVDVEIEPAFPIKKFITRITVNKAGGLSQSGFGA